MQKKPISLLKDGSYGRGMNDIDDPMALGDGYCAKLVNAYPGYPVKMRKGVEWDISIYNESPYGVNSFTQALKAFFWKGKLFAWVRGADEVYLVYWDYFQGDYVINPIRFLHPTEPEHRYIVCGLLKKEGLSFESVGDVLYTRFVVDHNAPWMYPNDGSHILWLNEYKDCNMIAVEIGEDGVPFARFVPSSVINSVEYSPAIIPQMSPRQHYFFNTGMYNGHQVDDVYDNPTSDEALAEVDISIIGIYGISLSLVRRTDIAADAAPTVYHPGLIESPEARLTPQRKRMFAYTYKITDDEGLHTFYENRIDWSGPNRPYFGFTHIRIYRTRNFADLWGTMTMLEIMDMVRGATRYFMVDVPINAHTYTWLANGVDYNKFEDLVAEIEASDGELMGEANTIQSAPYNFPPADGDLMKYHKSRMFLLGKKGQVYFSEVPGGDGGTDLEMAQLNPERYALWHKLYDRYDLRMRDAVETTGIASFDDDLYFFKSNKIWCLVGGMPPAMPRIVSEDVGCPFGNTIVIARVDNENKIFFLGAVSPMLISAGGYVREFTDFKSKALWPASDRWAAAAFWDGKIWVFCGGDVYGYSVDEEYPGVFVVTLAKIHREEYKHRITNMAVLPDGGAILLGVVNIKKFPSEEFNAPVDRLVAGRFGEGYADALNHPQGYNEGHGHYKAGAIEMLVHSRRHIPGPLDRNMAELLKATVYCKFGKGEAPFTVEMKSNRFKALRDYNDADQRNKEYINNQDPIGKPYMRTNIALIPESDFMGERFEYEIVKKLEEGFDLYGAEMEVILRPNLDSDDLVGGEANKEIWVGDV